MTVAEDVLVLLGRDSSELTTAEQAVSIVTGQIRAYTRDRGFSGDQPEPDLATVVLTSAARLVSNPESKRIDKVGPFESHYRVSEGWTLPELAVLNRYRRRAR